MAFWAAVPAIASMASSLFGKKKSGGDTVAQQTVLDPRQSAAADSISKYIQQYMSQYQPGKAYGGDRVAGMSGFESTGLNRLEDFLAAPETGDLFGAASQNVMDTLGGKFADVNNSPFIKAMTNLSKMNLKDAIDTSRRSAGSRGAYFTDSAIREEGRITDRTLANLDSIIGEFTNQERGRQMQAVPLAQSLEKYKNIDMPLSKVGASQTFGALPRLLEQADMESQYNDFKRQQEELGKVPGQAQQFFGTNTPVVPSYTNPVVQENTPFGTIMNMISKLNFGALSGTGDIWSKLGGLIKG